MIEPNRITVCILILWVIVQLIILARNQTRIETDDKYAELSPQLQNKATFQVNNSPLNDYENENLSNDEERKEPTRITDRIKPLDLSSANDSSDH